MSTLTREQILAIAVEAATAAAVAAVEAALTQHSAPAPAKQATQPKADGEFVQWLRETAPQRAARKASNREMAAWLRSKNLPANGPVWAAAMKGERSVRTLRKLAV